MVKLLVSTHPWGMALEHSDSRWAAMRLASLTNLTLAVTGYGLHGKAHQWAGVRGDGAEALRGVKPSSDGSLTGGRRPLPYKIKHS
eukprot:5199048-Pyramimonas_sp.AAC.2